MFEYFIGFICLVPYDDEPAMVTFVQGLAKLSAKSRPESYDDEFYTPKRMWADLPKQGVYSFCDACVRNAPILGLNRRMGITRDCWPFWRRRLVELRDVVAKEDEALYERMVESVKVMDRINSEKEGNAKEDGANKEVDT
jgi:hypothetical protein